MINAKVVKFKVRKGKWENMAAVARELYTKGYKKKLNNLRKMIK